MLSTSAVGAGGFAGANARLPYPSPKEQKQDARAHSRRRKSQKRTTRPPKNQGENAGKNTARGAPPTQKKRRRSATRPEKPRKNRQNKGGRTLMKVPSGWKPMLHASSSSSRRKVVNKKNQKRQKHLLQILSSVGPPENVVLKNKHVFGTAHPPRGKPRIPKPRTTRQGPELKGPRYRQSKSFSREIRTMIKDEPEAQQQPNKAETISSGEFGLCIRGGGAHGPPRCSEVSRWGPGHRRCRGLLPSREPPHPR